MTRNAFWGLCIGLCLAGTQAIAQKMESKSIKTTDKTDSISFHIDGITEGETLFTVIGGPALMVFTGHANPLYWNQVVSMHWYMKTIP